MFHRLGSLACPTSELTYETMNPLKHFGRTPRMGDWPIARPLSIQDSTTQRHGCTSITQVGYESTIPASDQSKTICTLDHLAI